MRNSLSSRRWKLWLCVGALLLAGASVSTLAQVAKDSGAPQTFASAMSAANAAVTGTVTDSEGALVVGARVRLLGGGRMVAAETVSGSDGRFMLQHVRPGTWTLQVTLQGFEAASKAASLNPGETHEAGTIALTVSAAKEEVDVRGPAQASGEDEVKVEETQRLFGFLPNFYVSYDWTSPALSKRQKFQLAGRDMIDPGNLLLVGTVAGVQQATNSFPGYGQGAVGYGKRYGADYANLEVGTLLGEAVLPSLLHQDPRYFYKGTGSVRSRVWYALSFGVARRGDNGRRQFAYAGVLGDLSAGAVSNLYYPASDRHGAALTFENGLLGIAGDALNGLFQEFFARKVTSNAAGKGQKK